MRDQHIVKAGQKTPHEKHERDHAEHEPVRLRSLRDGGPSRVYTLNGIHRNLFLPEFVAGKSVGCELAIETDFAIEIWCDRKLTRGHVLRSLADQRRHFIFELARQLRSPPKLD